MLKIVLVGAPSSGKTALAQSIRDTLGYLVVDNYIADIEDRSDNTLGHFASYLGNLQAAIGRWEAERKIVRDHQAEATVTCGSIIETLIYNGIQALVQAKIDADRVTENAAANDKRSSLSMMMLGLLTGDTWDYDHAFYLPLPDDALEENKLIDSHILETANTMSRILTPLPLTTEAQLSVVLGEVLENEKANGQAVRRSDGEGEEAGLQGVEQGTPDAVPDVQDPA